MIRSLLKNQRKSEVEDQALGKGCLKDFKGLIIDLDGVVYLLEEAVHGSPEAIARIRGKKIPFVFLTNNSSSTPEQYSHKLSGFGIKVSPEQIVTSSQAVRKYLEEEIGDQSTTAFVIGEIGLLSEVKKTGLVILDGKEGENADVVIVGCDRYFNYEKLKAAVIAIRRGAVYIAANADATYPTPNGLWPGAGAIVAAVTTGAGREPTIAGKPSKLIVELALERLGMPREEVLLIGDRLDTDIKAGISAGVKTALVLTGVSKAEDIVETGISPDFVCESLSALVNFKC